MATPSRGCSAPLRATPAARPADAPRAAAATVTADAALAFSSYLRIAAIGAVVLIHSSSGLVLNNAIRGSATWWVGVVLNRGAGWAVPVFIMVSGALLLAPRPNEGAAAFYRRRLDRIAIPLADVHFQGEPISYGVDVPGVLESRGPLAPGRTRA